MIIKYRARNTLVRKSLFLIKKIKFRYYIVISFFLFTISIVGIGGLYFGAKIYGSEYSSVFASFYRYFRPSLNTASHFIKGFISRPDEIDIHIDHIDYQKLAFVVNNAKERGMIIREDKLEEVNAKVQNNGKFYDVKLKIRGSYIEHIRGDKWSFRIKVKDDKTLFGMQRFSISSPETRNHIHEWLFQKALKNESLISLRYKFVKVSLNGKNLGIYALEEFFDKRLIENNQLREGIIVKPNVWSETIKDAWFVYQEKKVLSDPLLKKSYDHLTNLVQLFKEKLISADVLFDINKTAKYFALTTIFGGQHGHLTTNFVCYFNPVTNLLEPIGYDSNVARIIERYGGMITSKSNVYHSKIFKIESLKLLFDSEEFFIAYLKNLNRMTNDKYIDNLLSIEDDELNYNLNILYKEYPYFNYFKRDYFKVNINYIRNQLNSEKLINATLTNYNGKDRIDVSVDNLKDIPIEVIGIEIGDQLMFRPQNSTIIKSTRLDELYYLRLYKSIVNSFPENYTDYNMTFVFKVIGLDKIHRVQIKDIDSILSKKIIKTENHDHIIYKKPNINLFQFLTINNNMNEIRVKNGNYIISRDLVIPPNFKFIVEAGTKLDIIKSANILSYSPLHFLGTKKEPIIILSSDSTGQGITVINASEKSIISYTKLKGLRNPQKIGLNQTGSINFYQSDIDITNIIVENNISEDALNIIRSSYKIYNSTFMNTYSDAFDGDFSDGLIINSTFYNCGNDAIDVSGSNVIIDSVLIAYTGDKGISIGEKSILNGKNIKIQNSEIGITSKDFSVVEVDNVTLSNTKVGFTAYQKKPEYGPGKIKVGKY